MSDPQQSTEYDGELPTMNVNELLEELRNKAYTSHALCNDAADKIEGLVNLLNRAIDHCPSKLAQEIADEINP